MDCPREVYAKKFYDHFVTPKILTIFFLELSWNIVPQLEKGKNIAGAHDASLLDCFKPNL